MKPVYVINGFLESGKTEFIKYTLEQPYFQIPGETLLIVCEEGINEYDSDLIKKSKTILEVVGDEEMFTPAYLMELEKKHKPERIMIECNGMWNYKDFKFPWHWTVEQQVTTIDASTFAMYYKNMRTILAEMARKSELIIFNRCDNIEELSTFKRNMKAINQKAEIIFEDSNGEVESLMEDELPYDLSKDVIKLTHETYAIWYLDVLDHLDRYSGKTIKFVAQVLKPKNFEQGYFVPGRKAMTCCEDDIAFLGFVCKCHETEKFNTKDWVSVTATIKREFFEDYGGEGPVLYASEVKHCKPLKEEVIGLI